MVLLKTPRFISTDYLSGDAEKYDGQPEVLVVEPGTHLVTIKDGKGSIILERKVYVRAK